MHCAAIGAAEDNRCPLGAELRLLTDQGEVSCKVQTIWTRSGITQMSCVLNRIGTTTIPDEVEYDKHQWQSSIVPLAEATPKAEICEKCKEAPPNKESELLQCRLE